jgi:hypothetical protein
MRQYKLILEYINPVLLLSVTTSRFGFTLREAGTFSIMQTVSPMVL